MRGQRLYVALIISCCLLIHGSVVFGQSDKSFSGRPLSQVLGSSATISCLSDTAAVTGYYRNELAPTPDVKLESSALRKQSSGGGYKITFDGNRALVFDEFMKASYEFMVSERRPDGVVLIRLKGVGVEVITLDPVNGSFILTDAGVQTLWNRANVWTGRCS